MFVTQEKVFDVDEAIKDIIKTHIVESQLHKITIEYVTPDSQAPVEVITDAGRVNQVL